MASSLLTPSESHAFQSFLSSIDYDYSIVDHVVASAEWSSLSDDIPVPHAKPGKEALSKATKELMSLQPQAVAGVASAWSMADIDLPSLHRQAPTRTSRASLTPTPVPNPNILQDFGLAYQAWSDGREQHSSARRPSYARIPPGLPQPNGRRDSTLSTASSSAPPPPLPTRSSARQPSKRSFSEDSSASSTSYKRARASPPSEATPQPSGSATPPQSVPAGKPALLTASQKKANHIQSEQKRRANIRRGYEALCEKIPALREAIRAEEEANSAGAGSGSMNGPGRKRKTRGKVGDDGEKIDGRAGPRSENIVLAKTVDYLQELLSERQGLVERLQRARGLLPRNHPAQRPQTGGQQPLWEREWTGGDDANDDDGSDDDDS